MRRNRSTTAALLLACGALLGGCTTVGQVRNLGEVACGEAFEDGIASILSAQRETVEDAAQLAARARAALAGGALGPRPFAISAPSGTDYYLFVEPAEPTCLLRLYGRQQGFTRYTNNLTWIESRPLAGCSCTP